MNLHHERNQELPFSMNRQGIHEGIESILMLWTERGSFILLIMIHKLINFTMICL